MRYEAGDFAIIKELQMRSLEWVGHIILFAMVFHDFGSEFNLQQNGQHWHVPFMLIAVVQIRFELSTMLGILG